MGYNLFLHPVAVLISIVSGAAIAGILGIVLAAPMLATVRLILLYIWGKLLDIDPFEQTTVRHVTHSEMTPVLTSTRTHALTGPIYPEQSGEIVEE